MMGVMTDKRGLKPYDVELNVAAGRDEAWESVTQPAVLHQWFGWDYDGLDAEIRQIFVDEATLWAPERMGWADGSFLEVTGDDDRAVVRVSRDGSGPSGPERYDAIEEGWRAFLIQLRFLLDERPAGRRRTVYLTGETTGRQALALAEGGGEWERFGPRVAWKRRRRRPPRGGRRAGAARRPRRGADGGDGLDVRSGRHGVQGRARGVGEALGAGGGSGRRDNRGRPVPGQLRRW